MCRQLTWALVGLLWLAAPASAQLRDLVGAATKARVVRVIDGDTVEAIPDGEKRAIRVRLDGIDTPERGEPFTSAARRLTRVLVFDKTVTLRGTDVDRYGRLVARVIGPDGDTSLKLVSAGLACHYTRYSSDAVLAAAAAEARRTGKGFWAAGAGLLPRCARTDP